MKFFDKFKKKTKDILTKFSRTLVMNTSTGSAHWPDRNYENFARETYMKNVISYRCIFYISSSVASVKMNLFKQVENKREEIKNHPVNLLLRRANPLESFNFIILKAMAYFLISGNSYIEKISPDGGDNKGVPKELYVLRPDKIQIKTDDKTGILKQYIYDEKIPFDIDPITQKSDILHLKTFHPLDDFFGLSITESTAREIDSSNEAGEWQKKMFENEGRPGMVISIHGFLGEEQWDRLEKQLKEDHGGSYNAGKDLILEGENTASVVPYSWTPKEMDWIESNRELARKICLGYGVPPMLLGIPGDNTYSNLKEARSAFWEDTVCFYLNYFKDEFNNWIFGDNLELFLDHDLDNVPALAYKRESLWTTANTNNFLTINEKREMVGYEKVEGGDVLFVPFGSIPLGQASSTETGSEDIPEQEDDLIAEQDEEDGIDELVDQGMDEDVARDFIGYPRKKRKEKRNDKYNT